MSRPAKSIIEYRRYDLPLDFPLLFLDGDRWKISEVRSEHLHFHDCLEIGMCHAESGIMMFEDEAVEFHAGDITCVPRHIPHTTFSSPGEKSLWSYIFVNLGELFMDLFHNSTEDFAMPMTAIHNFRYLMSKEDFPKIHFLVSCIIDELRTQKSDYRMAVKSLFLAMYIELLRIQDSSDNKKEIDTNSKNTLAITPALNYIHQNYMNPFSIEELAELCHLSTTHFRRIFLSIMGNSPLDFINTTRIDKACTLLQTTDASILSISEFVGFRSISSFNRYFVRIMGVSPRDYRNPINRPDIKPERKHIIQYSGWL